MAHGPILLIQAPNRKWDHLNLASQRSMPPIGLLLLSSYMRKHGYEVKIIDMLVEEFAFADFEKTIKSIDPFLVGIQAYTETFEWAKQLSKAVKSILPEANIVFGGPMASFAFKETLAQASVDYVVMFEGEETLLELAVHIENPEAHPIQEIRGLAFRSEKEIVVNERRDLIDNLDVLPLPDRTAISMDDYAIPFNVMTSRGCPFDCSFCNSTSFWDRRFRSRSARSVFDEICHISAKYSAESFYICDDHFTAVPSRVREFCALLKESQYSPFWACESRVDVFTPDLADIMHDAGLRLIIFGIESGSPEILDSINKRISLKSVEDAVRTSTNKGIFTMCCFMLGHPEDTPQTMRRSMEFMKRLNSEYGARIVVSCNTPFPGTHQYDCADKIGIKFISRNWSDFRYDNPNISGRGFTNSELKNIFNEARDIFVGSQIRNMPLGGGTDGYSALNPRN